MLVETFELEEITNEAGLMAADHEAIELIEKLGLVGQQSLANKTTVTRMPYPKMTADQEFVYGQLFPQHVEIEKYSAGIIPIRVLQVISFLRENAFFKSLKIWHSSVRKDKDPVLVGYREDPEAIWREESFLIARWGDALAPFEELTKTARSIAFDKLTSRLSKARGEIQLLETQVKSFTNAQDIPIELLKMSPSFHH